MMMMMMMMMISIIIITVCTQAHGVEGTKARLETLGGRNGYLDWPPLARADHRGRAEQGSKGRFHRLPAILLSGVVFGSVYWAWRRGHIARFAGRIANFFQNRFGKRGTINGVVADVA